MQPTLSSWPTHRWQPPPVSQHWAATVAPSAVVAAGSVTQVVGGWLPLPPSSAWRFAHGVGAPLGAALGDVLGLVLGEAVGGTLGAALGEAEGVALGDRVGVPEGAGVPGGGHTGGVNGGGGDGGGGDGGVQTVELQTLR